MAVGLWGKKIGMSQLFDGDKVVPVTAIDVRGWLVTGVRTLERDGHAALQVGRLRDRYMDKPYSPQWLKQKKKYFGIVREIPFEGDLETVKLGSAIAFHESVEQGDMVDVFGRTRGRGFAGVVKRHNFAGPPASHGSTMGNRPGSIGFMCSNGRVVKQKAMPGHMGNVQRAVMNLQVVAKDVGVVFVKGAVPGHSGSLVFVRKS